MTASVEARAFAQKRAISSRPFFFYQLLGPSMAEGLLRVLLRSVDAPQIFQTVTRTMRRINYETLAATSSECSDEMGAGSHGAAMPAREIEAQRATHFVA